MLFFLTSFNHIFLSLRHLYCVCTVSVFYNNYCAETTVVLWVLNVHESRQCFQTFEKLCCLFLNHDYLTYGQEYNSCDVYIY